MAIDIKTTNLHEFGPQNLVCAGTVDDQSNDPLLDESGNPLCEEGIADVLPFEFTISGSSFAIGLEASAGGAGPALVYNFTVDWGDGNTDDITAWDDAALSHGYSGSQTWVIQISGICPNLSLGLSGPESGDRSKVTSITRWGSVVFTYLNNAFNDCFNMTITAPDNPDFSSVTDIRWCFKECRSIVTGPEGWNFSTMQTTSMRYLFDHCDNINFDASGWNLTGITDMEGVFNFCVKFNSSIAGWDTSAVTDMSFLFFFCDIFNHASIVDLDTSAVQNFEKMLSFAQALNQPIGVWDTSSGTNMDSMFRSCDDFNQSIDAWNVSGVTTMKAMFQDCFAYNQSMNSWITTACLDMSYMFDASFGIAWAVFTGNVAAWDTSNVTTMEGMFRHQNLFNIDIGGWNVSSVTSFFVFMFECEAFNQNLNSWTPLSALTMESMFQECAAFNGNVTSWNVGSVTNMQSIFHRCDIFDQDISGWNMAAVTDFRGMFQDCFAFNQPIGTWTTTAGLFMDSMFRGASAFNQDISGWNISAVGDFFNFMLGATSFSTANYDLLLNAWSLLSVSTGEDPTFVPSYTIATSQAARDILTDPPNSWTITDGGGI